VMWLYREKLAGVVAGLPSSPGARRFVAAVLVAFVPSLVAGALLAGFVKRVLYHSLTAMAVAFIVGGLVMLVVERLRPAADVREADRTPVGRAFGIGLCQTLALLPGVSRSGATIVGGMLMRLDRPAAAEFSFFLAMPTMIAAFTHDLWEVKDHLSSGRAAEIAVGFIAAFVAAALVVRPFLRFVARAGFAPFAWYRIGIGVLLLGALGIGLL
jgi:undecaprenyl-diphosphatase